MSPTKTRITATARTVDGAQLYFVDDEHAETVRGLTGSAAITEAQAGSLRALDFGVDLKQAKARRRRRKRGRDAERERRETKETVTTRANVISDQLIQHVVVVRQFTRTFPTSNVWVLDDGDEAALIDSGYGDDNSVNARLEYFEKELPGLDFRHIAITHHHFDHSSGARKLRDALKAETAINPIDEVLLHTPSESNEDLPDEDDIAERARVWHEEAMNAPIDVQLSDGDEFKVGGLTVRAVHTPGHTAGHNCYWVPESGTLFTGDNVLGVGTSAIGPAAPRRHGAVPSEPAAHARAAVAAHGAGPRPGRDRHQRQGRRARRPPQDAGPPDHRADRRRLYERPPALSRALPGDPEGPAPRPRGARSALTSRASSARETSPSRRASASGPWR